MKKLWIILLCALLAAALCTCALAEEAPPKDTEITAEPLSDETLEIPAEAVDEAVDEASLDIDLPEEISEIEVDLVATDTAALDSEETSDFEITNGILTKYNGPGGDVVIPDGVTVIGDNAFFDYYSADSKVTSITIPNSVTIISDHAFSYCPELTDVFIPNSVTSIGNYAFASCSKLKNIVIPDSVTRIGERIFVDCSSLTDVVIPKSITSITWSMFSGCNSLTSITIPDSITSIENFAFSECFSLTDTIIPNSVTYIGDYAFVSCTDLTNISLPESITSLGRSVFAGCDKLTSINIPEGITSIKWKTFEHCSNLTSMTIPGSVKSIEEDAFHGCINLTSVTFEAPQSLAVNSAFSINDTAFSMCPSSLVFHTPCESAATQWAESHGYTVVKTDHTPVTLPGRAATTTRTGLTEGKQCSACGAILEAQREIAMLPSPAAAPAAAAPAPAAADPAVAPVIPEFHMVKKATNTVNVGDVFRIVVDGKAVKSYKSGSKKVAGVAADGTVIANRAGKAKITVTLAGKKKKKLVLTVKVVDPYAPAKVALAEGKSVTLRVGQTLRLNPVLSPATARTSYKWKSSRKGVAGVDGDGVVTAKKKGTARITVTTANKKKTTIKVKVVK